MTQKAMRAHKSNKQVSIRPVNKNNNEKKYENKYDLGTDTRY